MSNRTRRAVRTVPAVIAALLMPFALAAFPVSAHADDPVPTSTALAISGGASYGDPMTLRAVVTSGAGTPTGSVTFSIDGGAAIASGVPVDATGQASVTTTAKVTGLTGYRAAFSGSGAFGDSTGFTLLDTSQAGVVLKPDPSLLQINRTSVPTLTMSLSGRVLNANGSPAVGVEVLFSVFGRQPTMFDFGGSQIVCATNTDAQGYARCGPYQSRIGSVVALLAGGAFMTSFGGADYAFGSTRVPIIVLSGQ